MVDNFESEGYNEGDFLPFYFQQMAHDWKRYYLYIPTDDPTILNALLEFPQLPFIVAQQDPENGYDYSKFSRWAIYNNKTHAFEKRSNDPPYDPLLSSFRWISEYLVPKVLISVVEAQNYLAMIRNAMTSVYELMADFHSTALQRILSPFDGIERKIIILLTETYFQVNLEDVIPAGVFFQIQEGIIKADDVTKFVSLTDVPKDPEPNNLLSDLGSTGGLLTYLGNKIDRLEGSRKSQSSNEPKPPIENIIPAKPEDLEIVNELENMVQNLEMNEISWESRVQDQYSKISRNIRCSPENISILQNSTNILLSRVKQILKKSIRLN